MRHRAWPRSPRRRCLPTSASPPTRRSPNSDPPSAPATSPPSPRPAPGGREDLVGRGLEAGGGKTLRLFSTWEITRYLIPVAPAHFRRVLPPEPHPPPGPHRDRRAAPSGSPSTRCCACAPTSPPRAAAPSPTCPWRPAGLPAKIAAIANFKGGVGKTSMAAHLAMSAALDGYRVLVVDLDSQGSMTSIFGGKVASEWDTVFPLIARDYALGLQAENRRRVERGDPPLPLDETLEAAWPDSPRTDVIQKTHWPNIDLIGAQLNLYWAEFQIPVWRMSLRGWKLWEALGEPSSATACSRPTTSSSSIRPPPSATSRSTASPPPTSCSCRSAPPSSSSTPRAASSTCCTRPSHRSRTARTSPPARSAAPRSASNGTRCAPSSPATTPASRPSWPG